MRIRASAPGKLVALGEYAVLEGAPALVLAVERRAVATLERSGDGDCHLRTAAPDPVDRRFSPGRPSGASLVDLVIEASPGAPAWRGMLDSSALYDGSAKLGHGSSAAGL